MGNIINTCKRKYYHNSDKNHLNYSKILQPILKESENFNNKGNSFFISKNYKEAVSCYSDSINHLNNSLDKVNLSDFDINEKNKFLAKYYTNRSNAYIGLKELDKSIIDSNTSLSYNKNWFKGYIRKINILNAKKDKSAFQVIKEAKEVLIKLGKKIQKKNKKNNKINNINNTNTIERSFKDSLEYQELNKYIIKLNQDFYKAYLSNNSELDYISTTYLKINYTDNIKNKVFNNEEITKIIKVNNIYSVIKELESEEKIYEALLILHLITLMYQSYLGKYLNAANQELEDLNKLLSYNVKLFLMIDLTQHAFKIYQNHSYLFNNELNCVNDNNRNLDSLESFFVYNIIFIRGKEKNYNEALKMLNALYNNLDIYKVIQSNTKLLNDIKNKADYYNSLIREEYEEEVFVSSNKAINNINLKIVKYKELLARFNLTTVSPDTSYVLPNFVNEYKDYLLKILKESNLKKEEYNNNDLNPFEPNYKDLLKKIATDKEYYNEYINKNNNNIQIYSSEDFTKLKFNESEELLKDKENKIKINFVEKYYYYIKLLNDFKSKSIYYENCVQNFIDREYLSNRYGEKTSFFRQDVCIENTINENARKRVIPFYYQINIEDVVNEYSNNYNTINTYNLKLPFYNQEFYEFEISNNLKSNSNKNFSIAKNLLLLNNTDIYSLLFTNLEHFNNVNFYSFDTFTLAKNIILWYAFKNKLESHTIIQIWFSTMWTDDTNNTFTELCRYIIQEKDHLYESEEIFKLINSSKGIEDLLINRDSKDNNDDKISKTQIKEKSNLEKKVFDSIIEEIKQILEGSKVSASEIKELWQEHFDYNFICILKDKTSRIEYLDYIITGDLSYINNDSSYYVNPQYGNKLMFRHYNLYNNTLHNINKNNDLSYLNRKYTFPNIIHCVNPFYFLKNQTKYTIREYLNNVLTDKIKILRKQVYNLHLIIQFNYIDINEYYKHLNNNNNYSCNNNNADSKNNSTLNSYIDKKREVFVKDIFKIIFYSNNSTAYISDVLDYLDWNELNSLHKTNSNNNYKLSNLYVTSNNWYKMVNCSDICDFAHDKRNAVIQQSYNVLEEMKKKAFTINKYSYYQLLDNNFLTSSIDFNRKAAWILCSSVKDIWIKEFLNSFIDNCVKNAKDMKLSSIYNPYSFNSRQLSLKLDLK